MASQISTIQGLFADAVAALRDRPWEELFYAFRQCRDHQHDAWAFLLSAEMHRRLPSWRRYYANWTDTQVAAWQAERSGDVVTVRAGFIGADGVFLGRQWVVPDVETEVPVGWQYVPCPWREDWTIKKLADEPRYVGEAVFAALEERAAKPVEEVPDFRRGVRREYLRLLSQTADPDRRRIIEEEWFRLGQEWSLRGVVCIEGELTRYVELRCSGQWVPSDGGVGPAPERLAAVA